MQKVEGSSPFIRSLFMRDLALRPICRATQWRVGDRSGSWYESVPGGSGHYIQAVNREAWNSSEWGVFGDFDLNYPADAPSPDDPGIQDAVNCASSLG